MANNEVQETKKGIRGRSAGYVEGQRNNWASQRPVAHACACRAFSFLYLQHSLDGTLSEFSIILKRFKLL